MTGEEAKILAKEVAAEIAPAVVDAMSKAREGEVSERELVELKNDFKHAQEAITTLKKVVFEQHEPVVSWSRNFMDSYRKIITVVITSGIITLIGLLLQLYYVSQKGK